MCRWECLPVYSRHWCPVWDEAGDSDYKTNDVDNVKNENAYLCNLDIDVQCEMSQVTVIIKKLCWQCEGWECLPVYSRYWCPMWDEAGHSDYKKICWQCEGWECLPVYSRHWCPMWDEAGDSDYKQMMLMMCRWECLPVYSRHWCPVWDKAGDSDDKTNDVDDVQDKNDEVDVQKLSAVPKNPETCHC
jgi:hypothetical protein